MTSELLRKMLVAGAAVAALSLAACAKPAANNTTDLSNTTVVDNTSTMAADNTAMNATNDASNMAK